MPEMVRDDDDDDEDDDDDDLEMREEPPDEGKIERNRAKSGGPSRRKQRQLDLLDLTLPSGRRKKHKSGLRRCRMGGGWRGEWWTSRAAMDMRVASKVGNPNIQMLRVGRWAGERY
ncbi:hypothetical protein E4U21_005928 [Claviceps maximensis]|nr:hypothetical protein E4U21_005928 [Claviceps maximensis]